MLKKIIILWLVCAFFSCTLDNTKKDNDSKTTHLKTPISEPTPSEPPLLTPESSNTPSPTPENYNPNLNTINHNFINEDNFYHISNRPYFDYQLELGDDPKNVYFIFTNPTFEKSMLPKIEQLSTSKSIKKATHNKYDSSDERKQYKKKKKTPMTLNDYIAYWNEIKLFEDIKLKSPDMGNKNISQALDYEGKKGTLYNRFGVEVPSTCRLVRKVETQFGPKTLNIWVADDGYYAEGTKKRRVDDNMIQVMADKFLKEGLDNDIYDWVTNILGEEWSDLNLSNYIPDKDEITIFLYDIENDNGNSKGGVTGFFWSKDLAKKTSGTRSARDYSNERLMFYMDSVLFASESSPLNNENELWEITDYWPSRTISTLAHEFQHMINAYQKAMVQNKYKISQRASKTWLNELMSMCIEDLLADKILSNGPRGVDYNDYSAGQTRNPYGRLPRFNYFNFYSLFDWEADVNKSNIKDYSSKYAFGAYLIRNFGGAQFVRDLLFNKHISTRAIEYALEQSGTSNNLSDILMKWATAVVLSDSVHNKKDYLYNTGSEMVSTLNGVSYKLGAINFYNYFDTVKNQNGPRFLRNMLFRDNPMITLHPNSNYYFELGRGLSGVLSYRIRMDSQTRLTVVVK